MIGRIRVYISSSNFLLVGFLGEHSKDTEVHCRILRIQKTYRGCIQSNVNLINDLGTFSLNELHTFMTEEKQRYKDQYLILKCECWGVIGLFQMLHSHYLLLIKSRKYLGNLCGHRMYMVSQVERICLSEGGDQGANEQRYLKLLDLVDLTNGFYFSYTYPLWQNLQTNVLFDNEDGGQSKLNPFLSQYVWNSHLSSGLREISRGETLAKSWVVPIVHGYIEQRQFILNGQRFKLLLIARRSRLCAGARYHRRGLDRNGRVANFVETEQVVVVNQKQNDEEAPRISSMVQIRGSVPLFWTQKASTFQPRPEIRLRQIHETQYQTTLKHFNRLEKEYGKPIVVLNLLRQKERNPRESILRDEFTEAVSFINAQRKDSASHVIYFPVDIKSPDIKEHGVVPTMVYILQGASRKTGFFSFNPLASERSPRGDNTDETIADVKLNTFSFQNGVLRTNCVDCLDRTNVAQFTFGLCTLSKQLSALELDGGEIKTSSSMAVQLMNMYERMGNALSQQYGGSNAHSKVFSKQRGERWSRAKLKDMFVSMRRYYSNTIVDPDKQDGIDLFLGNYVPQEDRPHIWEVEKEEGVRYVMYERLLKAQVAAYKSLQYKRFQFGKSADKLDDKAFSQTFEQLSVKLKNLCHTNSSPFFYYDKAEEFKCAAEETSMLNTTLNEHTLDQGVGSCRSRKLWGPIQLNGLDNSVDGKYFKVDLADNVHLRRSMFYPRRSISLGNVSFDGSSVHDRPPNLGRHSIQVLNTCSQRFSMLGEEDILETDESSFVQESESIFVPELASTYVTETTSELDDQIELVENTYSTLFEASHQLEHVHEQVQQQHSKSIYDLCARYHV
eukprot:TRINITY_DN21231_c0_g1_i2.p1 TRINITY_DN21231_c0_g1~~TRINITY_DN21231_c0_g1_i2.p1  ORF type:complete len:842 (-),score=65.31 TRINITY_DN21231_c0_g1_i2:676-3201(-)